MKKKFRKPKPSPPNWYWWDNDNCWWCKADLGTCRINPIFATSYVYELIEMEDFKVNVIPEKGAF